MTVDSVGLTEVVEVLGAFLSPDNGGTEGGVKTIETPRPLRLGFILILKSGVNTFF